MLNDLRFAFRMLGNHRWFSAAVIVTLALGIGINTTVFTLVNAVRFKPVPVTGGDRLVIVSQFNPKESQGRGFSAADGEAGAPVVLLLGYGTWQRRYAGVSDILGRTVRLNPADAVCFRPRASPGRSRTSHGPAAPA